MGTGGDAMDIQFTPKRERFTFREKHLEVLEAYFKENQYPSMELREEIAHLCNMALSSTGEITFFNSWDQVITIFYSCLHL